MRFRPRRWWRSWSARVIDVTLAVLALLSECVDMAQSGDLSTTALLTVMGLRGGEAVALLFRRRWAAPVLLLLVTTDAVIWTAFQPAVSGPVSAMVLIGLYTCGRYLPIRAGWAAGAMVVVVLGTAIVIRDTPSTSAADPVFAFAVVFCGQFFKVRKDLRERGKAEAADSAVRAERRRIARELHDVVAHHISVMNVLIGAARTTMTQDPEGATDAMATAERTGREAMAEMRQLLAVLRAEEAEPGESGPFPGAAELPALVERTRSAGLPTDLDVSGAPRDLPAAIDLAVYRIVQEALTNTHRHAGKAHALVRLRYAPTAVEVEVLDNGRGGATPQVGEDGGYGGYGLGGMAERVALIGGHLEAGPRPTGGFRVHALIPLPQQKSRLSSVLGAAQ